MATWAEMHVDEPEQVSAERGALKFDSEFDGPHWVDWIDTDRLDMRSASDCIVGQAFEKEGRGYAYLHGLHELSIEPGDAERYYGFDTRSGRSYDVLREAWITEITNRKEQQ